MMDSAVAGVMERFGQQVEVGPAGAMSPARAFLQPIIRHRKEDQQYMPSPVGVRREDQYLYLGQADREIRAGRDRVRWKEQEFIVLSAHPIYMGEHISHWWAVLAPADKEEA